MIIRGRHVDVQRIIEALSIPVKATTNSEILMDCLFHNDTGANLSINRESGRYHCWVCADSDPRSHGGLVHLVVVIRSITYVEAEEYILRQSVTISGPRLLEEVRRSLHRNKSRPKQLEPIWDEVDRYYNPRHKYWRKTRHIDSWTAAKFMLGYDEKKNQAIIPVTVDGQPIGLIRRTMHDYGNRYIYPSKDDGFFRNELLFGMDRCSGGSLYLVEGPIDCLKVHQAGFNGVAVLGAYLSEPQSKLILEYSPDYIVLMTDEDEGGVTLATSIWEHLAIRNVYGVQLPKKDPAACTTWEIWEAVERKVHILNTYLPHVQRALQERAQAT